MPGDGGAQKSSIVPVDGAAQKKTIDDIKVDEHYGESYLADFIHIKLSAIRAIREATIRINAERSSTDINLTVPNFVMAEPKFRIPEALRNDVALADTRKSLISPEESVEYYQYQGVTGLQETSQKINQYFQKKFRNDKDINPGKCFIANGATNFVFVVLAAMERNNKQRRPIKYATSVPYYPTHESQSEINGRKFVPIERKDDETEADALRRAIVENAVDGYNTIKLYLFSKPSNPTGEYYNNDEVGRKQLTDLVNVCRKFKITLIEEQVYNDIAEKPNNVLTIADVCPDLFRQKDFPYLMVESDSKKLSIPGEHACYGVASSRKIAGIFGTVYQKTSGGISASAEEMTRIILDLKMDGKLKQHMEDMRKFYMTRVDKVKKGLIEAGLEIHPRTNTDHATFFVAGYVKPLENMKFPDTVVHRFQEGEERKICGLRGQSVNSGTIKNSKDFTDALLKAEIAAVVSLIPFGEKNSWGFRLSVTTKDEDEISRGIAGIKEFVTAIRLGRDSLDIVYKDNKIIPDEKMEQELRANRFNAKLSVISPDSIRRSQSAGLPSTRNP